MIKDDQVSCILYAPSFLFSSGVSFFSDEIIRCVDAEQLPGEYSCIRRSDSGIARDNPHDLNSASGISDAIHNWQ